MSDKPFFLKTETEFEQLENWLKARNYDSVSSGHVDRKGNRMIGLGKDRKPDSDWSRSDPRGLIIVLNDSLYDAAYKAVMNVGGFKQ